MIFKMKHKFNITLRSALHKWEFWVCTCCHPALYLHTGYWNSTIPSTYM